MLNVKNIGICCVGFEVIRAMTVKRNIFQNMTAWGGKHCLLQQGRRVSRASKVASGKQHGVTLQKIILFGIVYRTCDVTDKER
jgi:hypothetical protein